MGYMIVSSPRRLAITLTLTIFCAEIVVMSILPLLSVRSVWAVDLLDATILTVLIVPSIYFLVVRPLNIQIAKCDLASRRVEEEQKLNEMIVSSIPYPAMLVRGNDKVVIAANAIALQYGVHIGGHYWRGFGRTECIHTTDKDLADQTPEQDDTVVNAFGKLWDIYWLKITDNMYLHYAIDITERKRAEEAFSKDIGRSLTQASDTRKMLQECAEVMVRHLVVAFARIWTLNERENVLELQACAGMYTHIDGGHGRVPVGRFEIGRIMQQRKPHLTNAVVGDPYVGDQEWAKREGMVAFAGYPLLVGDRAVGVMAVFARRQLSKNTTAAMATVADSIAAGIQRKQAEAQIRLHSAAINAADDLIAILDRDGQIVFANEAFRRQTGHGPEEIIGRDLSILWPRPHERRSEQDAWAAIRSMLAWSGETLCRARDGSSYTADVSVTPMCDVEGHSEHLIVIARNITERKEYEGLLDYRAHHDILTDLPNRLLFSEELAEALPRHKTKHKRCAVLFIDLDNFKLVNDTMGHQAGDALLVEIAARLASCLREGDMLARMGGDEFTVLLKDLESADDVATVAQRMLEQVSVPFEIGGGKLVVGASIGVSTYPDNARDVDGLLKFADAAMYRAKELGRNNYQFFSDELSQASRGRLEMERDLRLAIERDEIKVYYQPIVDVRTMQVAGAEALLRWNHPEKGMISPGLFVPVAEETGLILQMGRMVMETACGQCKSWQEMGYADFEMSVNVSPVQLRNEALLLDVFDILVRTGLSPHSLNLEITETALAKNDYGEIDAMGRLKALGIKTCLDDFGIGYSSLSRLKDFPIVQMKVDGSFIKHIEHSANDRAMTESIIVMAHNLGIKVTAEWIENEEQMATIRFLDCDYAQGYLISPALSAEAFEGFQRRWSESRTNEKAA